MSAENAIWSGKTLTIETWIVNKKSNNTLWLKMSLKTLMRWMGSDNYLTNVFGLKIFLMG